MERKLGLEADTDRAALAYRPAGEAARDGAEEDRKLVGTARDEAVGQDARHGAEHRTQESPADRVVHHQRRRLPEQMLGVLLDDVGVHVLHCSTPFIGSFGLVLEGYRNCAA
jgi:hypothetical protein